MSRSKDPLRSLASSRRSGHSNNFTLSDYQQSSLSQNDPEVDSCLRLYFVLLDQESEHSCSSRLSTAFRDCKSHELNSEWIQESMVLDTAPRPGNVFVLDPFEGPAYDYLLDKYFTLNYFMIIGPQCLRYIFHKGEVEILHRGYPMFTSGMKDIVITLTGFRDKEVKSELHSLIRKMGGVVSLEYTMATTHIVADSILSDKCATAFSSGRPVMTADWIQAVWKESLNDSAHGTDPQFLAHECPIFYKLNICMSQVPVGPRNRLRKLIEENGGTFSPDLARRLVSILLVVKGEGDKFRHAKQWGIPCLSPDWVVDSESAGHVLPFADYLISGPDHPLSSTPTSKKAVKIPDMTICSVISHPPANVINTTAGSSFPNDSVMSEVNRDVIKKRGQYLDGCKVFICGEESLDKVKQLLIGSGAVRLDQLTENVSHIVVLGPEMPKTVAEQLKQFDILPHLVGLDWLVESARKRELADEELFAFEPKLEPKFQKYCSVVGDETDSRIEVQPRPCQWESEANGYADQVLHEDSHIEVPEESSESFAVEKGLFFGKTFVVMIEEDPDPLIDTIQSLSGRIAEFGAPDVDYVILSLIHDHPEATTLLHYTEQWILDCQEVNSLDIPIQIYHKPVLTFPNPEKILEGVVIAISSYTNAEKHYIIVLSSFMGAVNQHVFSRKGSDKTGLLASTHLLCPTAGNDKFRAAAKWKVPVAKVDWITDCYKARKRVSLAPYLVTEEDVSSDSSAVMVETPTKLLHSRTVNNLYTTTLRNATLRDRRHSSTPSGSGPVTPMGPPLPPKGSEIEVSPAEAEGKGTSTSPFVNPFDDHSLGFSPSEIRREMGICGVLPSPQTPKVQRQVWDQHMARLRNYSLHKDESLDSSGDPPRGIPPFDLSHIQDEGPPVKLNDSKGGGLETLEGQRKLVEELERLSSDSRRRKRANESVSEDEGMDPNLLASRKRPRSDETFFLEGEVGFTEEDLRKLTKANKQQSALSRKRTLSGYGSLKVKRVTSLGSGSSLNISSSSTSGEDSLVVPESGSGSSPSPPKAVESQSAASIQALGLLLQKVVTSNRERGKEPKRRPKPQQPLPLLTEGPIIEVKSLVGWDVEGDPLEKARLERRALAHREQEAEEALYAEMEDCEKMICERQGGKAAEKKKSWVFLFSGQLADQELLRKTVEELGGKVWMSEKFDEVSMLVASALNRSEKTLSCIAGGKPICHPAYILASKEAGKFIPIADEFLWKPAEARKGNELELASGFSYWYNRIRLDPAAKPFSAYSVLLCPNGPEDKIKYDSYKKILTAGGASVVAPEDYAQANLIIGERRKVDGFFERARARPKVPVHDTIFINNVLLKPEAGSTS